MSRKNPKSRSRRGYTLVELMVALVVLSVGLFSVIHLQIVSIRGNSFAEEINQATLIAMGVKEQIETQGLQWVDRQGTTDDVNMATSMPHLSVDTAPSLGNPVDFSNMKSVQTYNGCAIANGDDISEAMRINYQGITGDTAGLIGEGALYRVHYVAHPVRLTSDPTAAASIPAEAVNSLVKVQVFVSWYNREHGPKEGYDWNNWDDTQAFTTDEDSYCNRHMVVTTFYLAQNVQ